MAKALLGYVASGPRKTSSNAVNEHRALERLTVENRRLHRRVADLEALVTRLSEENDALAVAPAPVVAEQLEDMQPA